MQDKRFAPLCYRLPCRCTATHPGKGTAMEVIRYAAAACQTALPNPQSRRDMSATTNRLLAMIDAALAGSAPFLPVRLVVFPEFAHAAPVFPTVAELLEKLAVPIPHEHTERLAAKAREHGIYIQTGTRLEADSQWPEVVFNTTCLLGPEGILYKYRKVVVFQIWTFPGKYALVVPPLRGDAPGPRPRDVPLWPQRSGHQRRPHQDRQTMLSLPTDHLCSPFLRAGARFQRSLPAGQSPHDRDGAQR